MTKSLWTDSELDALARSLLFRFPGRGLDRVTQPHQVELNDLELTPSIKDAIAPHRQAMRPKLNRLKRDLVPALIRVTGRTAVIEETPKATARRQGTATKAVEAEEAVKQRPLAEPLPEPDAQPVEAVQAPQPDPKPAPVQAQEEADNGDEAEELEDKSPAGRRKGNKQKQSKIRWSEEEWRVCALALHTMAPSLNLIDATTEGDLKGLSLRELNLAAGVMEPGRRRSFKWLKGPAARLLQEYARARRDRDPLYFGENAKAEPAAVAGPAAAPAAGPAPAPVTAPDSSKDSARSSAAFSRAGEQRIFWSAAEWVEIAMEIDRLHPHARYADRGTTGALTVQDIAQAQRVLPPERRRQLRTASMEKLRPLLLQGLREVKALKAEAAAAQHAAALASFEERRTPPPPPPPNPWEQALRPLVELVVQQLGAQLVPMIVQALTAQQAANSPAAHIASVTSITAAMTGLAKPLDKPKKMSIGVCNNRLTFADELRREYPEVDFTFIEVANPHIADSVKNCDKVLLMTKWTSHTMQNRLKKQVGDRLILVNGSTSDIKRIVNGLLSSTERKTA